MNENTQGNSIRIHQLAKDVTVLGPGKRFVLWVQGCMKRCPGCIAPDAQPLDGGKMMTLQELTDTVLDAPEAEGLTISGGEPFLQSRQLARLIQMIRSKKPLGVIVYTGYLYEELLQNCVPDATLLLKETDLLVDGPYMEKLNDDGALRGSSNQRAILLTERYREYAAEYGAKNARRVEIMIADDQFFMIGVPSKELSLRIENGRKNN